MIFFIFFVIAYAQYIDGPVQAAGGVFEIMLLHNLAQIKKKIHFNNNKSGANIIAMILQNDSQ